jgi:hypothetical protein
LVAIDGKKMAASASSDANRDFGEIAREILAEAAAIDEREDELYGSARGDELLEQLRTREGRRQALREAKQRLARERDQTCETPPDGAQPVTVALDSPQGARCGRSSAPPTPRSMVSPWRPSSCIQPATTDLHASTRNTDRHERQRRDRSAGCSFEAKPVASLVWCRLLQLARCDTPVRVAETARKRPKA